MIIFADRMKIYRFIFICFFIATQFRANACDVCGCSIGGTNFGILPQFHKHFIGIQYNFRNFNSEHLILGTETKSISTESFQKVELRGRFNLSKRIQLFVFLPLSINQQTENNLISKISGLGDISTFANYSIYNNGDSLNKKWKHNFQLGVGFKLPIGKYNTLNNNNELNPNIQTGTGSFDILLDVIYTVRYRKIGLNNSTIYRFNNSNSNNFQFGNRYTFATNLFYWANIKGYSLLPSIGAIYENTQKDKHNNAILTQSGGNTLLSSIGLDFYYRKFSFGTNIQIPTYQDNNITKSKLKFSTTLLFNF